MSSRRKGRPIPREYREVVAVAAEIQARLAGEMIGWRESELPPVGAASRNLR